MYIIHIYEFTSALNTPPKIVVSFPDEVPINGMGIEGGIKIISTWSTFLQTQNIKYKNIPLTDYFFNHAETAKALLKIFKEYINGPENSDYAKINDLLNLIKKYSLVICCESSRELKLQFLSFLNMCIYTADKFSLAEKVKTAENVLDILLPHRTMQQGNGSIKIDSAVSVIAKANNDNVTMQLFDVLNNCLFLLKQDEGRVFNSGLGFINTLDKFLDFFCCESIYQNKSGKKYRVPFVYHQYQERNKQLVQSTFDFLLKFIGAAPSERIRENGVEKIYNDLFALFPSVSSNPAGFITARELVGEKLVDAFVYPIDYKKFPKVTLKPIPTQSTLSLFSYFLKRQPRAIKLDITNLWPAVVFNEPIHPVSRQYGLPAIAK